MRIAALAITEGGIRLAKQLTQNLEGAVYLEKKTHQKTAEVFAENWSKFDGFICVMAAGIVVRSIAPLIQDKAVDPCILVVDEKGRNVISLLSGHLGGGNYLTHQTAAALGANPVITTASDTLDLAALDIWAKENKLVPPTRPLLTALSTRLVNTGSLKLFADVTVKKLPKGILQTQSLEKADFAVTHKVYPDYQRPCFRPLNLVLGTGCNRGTPSIEFEEAFSELFAELQISKTAVRNIASIDKKNDEVGLLEFAENNKWKIDFFDKEIINSQTNLEISLAALKAVGAIGVAEPASLLSAQSDQLLCRKRKWKNVTMAVALVPFTL